MELLKNVTIFTGRPRTKLEPPNHPGVQLNGTTFPFYLSDQPQVEMDEHGFFRVTFRVIADAVNIRRGENIA